MDQVQGIGQVLSQNFLRTGKGCLLHCTMHNQPVPPFLYRRWHFQNHTWGSGQYFPAGHCESWERWPAGQAMEPLLASKPAGPSNGSRCTSRHWALWTPGGVSGSGYTARQLKPKPSCPKTLTHPVLWVLCQTHQYIYIDPSYICIELLHHWDMTVGRGLAKAW